MSKSQITNQRGKEETTKRFIHSLDQLIGQGEKKLYGKISSEKIQEIIESFPVVDDEGNNFSIFSSIQKFRKFAPGVYLMFRLLKHLMLMFGIISIIAIVQIVILFKSPFYKGYESVVRINMLRLTIASLQVQDFQIYIFLDAIILIVICAFYVWWNQKIRTYANSCNEENWLPSYLTVQIQNVDSSFTESSLRLYLSSQGITPQQIYTGRNYGKFLSHYKKLTQYAIELRIMKELFGIEEDEEKRKKQSKKIIQKFLQLKKVYCSIKQDKFNEKKYKPKEVFIVLKNYSDRQKLLSKPSNLWGCSKEQTQQQQHLFKACQVEPEAIAWENIGISFFNYSIRAIVVFIVLSLVTCLGVFIIFMLEILETASIGDAYHYHEEAIDYEVGAASSEEGMGCKDCHQVIDSAKLTILILLTPFVIFLCKKLIMGLLSHFVKFRKYPSQISRIKSQTITLAVFYFTVICALHLFLYLKTDTPGSNAVSIYELLHPLIVKMFNITNYNPASIHLYSDYSLDWYKEATFFIIIICSTSFNIANGFKLLVNFVSFQIQKYKARRQKIMYQVKNCLKGVDLHMENVYASMIVINYFALLYGCPIPITVCFCFINLVFLFYSSKFTLIKICHKPMRMGHSINRTVTNMLFLGIILHCIMTPIFLFAKGIGQNNAHYKYSIQHPDETSKEKTLSVQERFQRLGPFYLTVGSIITLYVLLRKPFVKYVLPHIKNRWLKKQEEPGVQSERDEKKTDHFGLYPTYSMHNNHYYGEVLKNVFLLNRMEAKRATCPIPKTLKQLQNSICEEKLEVFKKILDINRNYLDKQRYLYLYEEVEDLVRIQQSSDIQVSSILDYYSERVTNDQIVMDAQMTDRVKEQD